MRYVDNKTSFKLEIAGKSCSRVKIKITKYKLGKTESARENTEPLDIPIFNPERIRSYQAKVQAKAKAISPWK